MEPSSLTITIRPHEEPGRWSLHVEREGLFSEETQALYGFVHQTNDSIDALVLEALHDQRRHEIASEAFIRS